MRFFQESKIDDPSHDTFQSLFDAIYPDQFHKAFFCFTQQLQTVLEGVLAIDGKTIRNSGKNPLHLVNAWSDANKLVLVQVKGKNKLSQLMRWVVKKK